MKNFEYGDKEIGQKEVAYAVSNMVIGLGILTLPSTIVAATTSSDGWMSILLGGLIALGCAWAIAKLVMRFPKMNYYEITAKLTNPAVASIVTLLFALYMFLFVSIEVRGVSSISKLYLFDTTPVEAICFFFLLVLFYGVAGPSVSLLRLNLLYLPVIVFIVLAVLIMSLGDFNIRLLKPAFVTPWSEIAIAAKETSISFLGFEILLFYNVFVNKPQKTVKSVLLGLLLPLVIYELVLVFVIGVFGTVVVANTMYPLAEMAKQIEVPGGFFERFESLFFAVWVMSLFSTAAMALDITLLALRQIFRKTSRMTFIIGMAPLLFLIAMQPKNIVEVRMFSTWVSYMGIGIAWIVPVLLLLMAKLRGVRGDA